MDPHTANQARAVAAAFDTAVQQQVERLIRGEQAPRRFAIDASLVLGIAQMIIAVLQMIQAAKIASDQKDAEALKRQILVQIVPPPDVSDQTMEKIVRAAVAEALKSPITLTPLNHQ